MKNLFLVYESTHNGSISMRIYKTEKAALEFIATLPKEPIVGFDREYYVEELEFIDQ